MFYLKVRKFLKKLGQPLCLIKSPSIIISHISKGLFDCELLISTKDPLFSLLHVKHSYSVGNVDDATLINPDFELQTVSSSNISLPIEIVKYPSLPPPNNKQIRKLYVNK